MAYPNMTAEEIITSVQQRLSDAAKPDTPESIAFFGEPRTHKQIAAQWDGLAQALIVAAQALRARSNESNS